MATNKWEIADINTLQQKLCQSEDQGNAEDEENDFTAEFESMS